MEVIKSQIGGLKKQVGEGTLKMVILGLVTFGIYNVIWLFERYKIFNEMAGKEIISRNFLITIAVVMGLSSLCTLIPAGHLWSSIFNLAMFFMMIVASFRVSKMMELFYLEKFGIELKFNPIFLVLLYVYYINYCINELEEIEQKENIKKVRS